MKIVNVHEAKSTLSSLLTQVEQGEDVVIARSGKPVARLVACRPDVARIPGSWRSLPGWGNFQYDSAIFAPMTDDELLAEGWL